MLEALKEVFSKEKERVITVRESVVRGAYHTLKDYSEWYDQKGLYLPPKYAADPSGWSEAMHKMVRAFSLLNDELEHTGELWEAKHKWEKFGEEDTEKIKELEEEIEEGLRLFGENLYYFDDPKKQNG